MENPKISIIVPVYNAERYLHRCVDSILTQTFSDFEVLLIDDGSKDYSGAICDEYAQRDDRVRVWHKENGGVSSARNVGLDNVRGEWVTFVDSDDWISSDFVSSIESVNSDLIILQCQHITSAGQILTQQVIQSQLFEGKNEVREFLSHFLLYHIMLTPWGKMYKRSLIADYRFDKNQRIGEDVIFVHQYLMGCNSILVRDMGIYFYLDEDENFCNKYSLTPEESLCHLNKIICQYRTLKIYNPQFEAFELGLFLSLCKDKLVGSSEIWFHNPFIKNLMKSCRPALNFKIYLKYKLFNVPWFYDIFMRYDKK